MMLFRANSILPANLFILSSEQCLGERKIDREIKTERQRRTGSERERVEIEKERKSFFMMLFRANSILCLPTYSYLAQSNALERERDRETETLRERERK